MDSSIRVCVVIVTNELVKGGEVISLNVTQEEPRVRVGNIRVRSNAEQVKVLLPDGIHVLSIIVELFIRNRRNQFTTSDVKELSVTNQMKRLWIRAIGLMRNQN